MTSSEIPKISVVIYSYNFERFLKESIESILAQTLLPYEILICDDHSTDKSWDIICKYSENYPDLIKSYRHKKNIGMTANGNFGFKKIKGGLISWLDGDDRWLPTKLELEWKTLRNYPGAKIAYSNVYIIDFHGNRKHIWDDGKYPAPPAGDAFVQVFSRRFFPNSNSVFRNHLMYRSVFDEIGHLDENLEIYIDWDFKIKATAKYPIVYSGVPLVEYRVHKQGISNSPREVLYRDMIRVYEKNIHLANSRSWNEIETIKNGVEQELKKIIPGETTKLKVPAFGKNIEIVKHLYKPYQPVKIIEEHEKSKSKLTPNIRVGENLIFLISQPRAGSTLLQRILNGHSDIHTTAEPWIMLHPIYALKRNGLDAEYESSLARQGLDDFLMQVPEGEELYIEALREMANVLYNKMINVSKKKYFLDKTPRYYFIIPELYRVFPKAKFIFLMRNPIAVLSSVLKTWCGNILQNLVNRPIHTDLIKGPYYLLEGIKRLKEDAIVVHYEKLVQNPKEVMQHVCNRIGIQFNENMLEYGKHPAPEGRFGDSVGVHKHISPVSEYIDKWTENLASPDLIEFAQKYLLDLGPEVISRMGYSYQNIKDKLEPKKLYYRKSRGGIEESSELNQQGEDLFAKDNFDGALDAFTKALDIDQNNATIHNNLGVLHYNRGDKEKAFSHYKKAAELQPENITFQKNLADFYYVELGRVEEAMQIYVKVLNANPEDVETLLIIGHICVALKKFDDAKDFYSRILIVEPWNKDAKQFLEELEKCQLSVADDRLGSEDIEIVSKEYFVSAIVSTYNSERFIRGCLEDLENQTIADRLEIIVVNSGSEHNEDKIIKEFQEKYSNIKYIKTDKRETVYAAWNRGIKATTGKYITNANTDDRHRKDAFEVMINILETHPETALVYADIIITETENETFESCTPVGYFNWMNWKREDLLNKGCFMGPQPMWRRDVHDEYGYFDDSFVTSGDYEFWLRISQTNIFLHLPVRLGLYLRSPGSIEHSNREKQQEENDKIFKMYKESHSSGKNIRHIETDLPQASAKKIDERIESSLKAINPDIQVSIIITTSNQQKYIKKCVESIEKYTSQLHEILFVDNGATKGTRKWLKQNINDNSNYKLVNCSKDANLSGIYNEGIKASTGQNILLLSNDVVVTKDWLNGMFERLKSIHDAGVVGPMSNISRGTQKVSTAKNVSTDQLDEFAESFMNKNRNRRISTFSIDGFCMLFGRNLVETIGFFDEKFGKGGYEDKDFCLRALLEGRKNLIAGDVYVHQQSKKAVVRNKKYFNAKWNKADAQSPSGKKFLTLKAVEKGCDVYQRGHIDNAVEILLEGIGLSPDDKRPYYALTEVLINSKQYKNAIEVLNEMPQDEKDIKRLELLGYCEEGMENTKEAQDYADRILSIDGNFTQALNLKGILAFKQGDIKSAEDYFNRAIESDPGYGEPYTNLGATLWHSQPEGALDLFEKGFILSPTSQDIVTNYHSTVTASGEFERAGQVFEEACSLYPNNKTIRYQLIDVLIKQKKNAEAMRQIEEAIVLYGVDDGVLSAALKIRDLLGPIEIDKGKEKKNSVSLCMIVKNEEEYLPRCLKSVIPVIDEMIVVDTGSTDRTKEIARAFGAKIYDFKWTDDFSEARNFSISKASGRWTFHLDADEVISSLDYEAFRKIIRQSATKKNAFLINTRNYTMDVNQVEWTANDGKYDKEESATGWTPSEKVRLFRNESNIRFEYPIHEMVDPSLKRAGITVKECSIPVHHYGKLNKEKSSGKVEVYYQIGRKKLDKMGDDAVALRELAIQAEIIKKHDEAIELWERFIAIEPNVPKAYINMGISYCSLGKFEEVLETAKKAMKLAPDMKEAHYNYALGKLHLGSAAEAVSILEKLLERLGEYPPAQFLLAAAYCCNGKKDKGINELKELQKSSIGPGLPIRCHELAKGLVSSHRNDYAIMLLEAAIDSKNSNKDVLELYSKCLEMMNVDRKTGTKRFA